MKYPISDIRSWKQYIPNGLGILNTSFQEFHLLNPSGTVTERSMLTIYELAVLYMLARDHYSGEGEILDLGPLLGVSTNALARGLDLNRHVSKKEKRIFAFDLFLARDMGSVISEQTVTGSIFDRFIRNNIDYLKYLSISPGNLLDMRWRNKPIEILFVDIAKSWQLNRFVVEQFFSCLIPGRSVVIQQDYVHFYEYWIHITMEYFRDYFDLLYMVSGSSGVYLYKAEIPNEMLYCDMESFPLDTKLYYLEKARDRIMFPEIREVMKCAQVFCLIEHARYQDAYKLLETVDVTAGSDNKSDPTTDFSGVLQSNAQNVNDLLKQSWGKGVAFSTPTGGLMDSFSRDSLLCDIAIELDKTVITSKEPITGAARITNTGTTAWQLEELPIGRVRLGSHLLAEDGQAVIERDYSRHSLATEGGRTSIKPGEIVTIPIEMQAPRFGKYVLEFDLVAEMITWFAQKGSVPVRIPVSIV